MKPVYKRGFTLIELLVVISIISFLFSVVISSINDARERSRDVARLSELKSIQNALAIYFSENGSYPDVTYGRYKNSTSARQLAWENDLMGVLVPDYLGAFTPSEDLETGLEIWKYDSDSGDNFKTYGLAVRLESSKYDSLETGDGGSFNPFYEVGFQPSYCNQTYSGSDSNWTGSNNVCQGGN